MATTKITLNELRTMVRRVMEQESMLKESEAPIKNVFKDGKMVGTHQYGVGFKPNEIGLEMGLKAHPTSIPNGTKIEDSSDPKAQLNEDKLVLSNYAKQLYSLFKKAGATPLVVTGVKSAASPDMKNFNVYIVTTGDELQVGIKGVDKPTAEKYMGLVSRQFPDLQLKGGIRFGTGWGGEKDSYADLTLIPKTTKKGGAINQNQRSNPLQAQQPAQK